MADDKMDTGVSNPATGSGSDVASSGQQDLPAANPATSTQSVPEMFQAIMSTITQSKEDIKTEVRAEVKAGFDAVNSRFDEVEDDVVQLQSTTSLAVRKITVLENCANTTDAAVKNIDQRVVALETGASLKQLSLTAVLQRETDRVRSLLDDAKAFQRVAIVGCHGRREPTKAGIVRLINEHSSGIEVRFDIRSLVARVTFADDGKQPPAT
jgi:hypothetical protein